MRHLTRHLEESVRAFVETILDDAGWMAPAAVDRPFGAGLAEVTTTLTGMPGTDPGAHVAVGTASPVVGVALIGSDDDRDAELGGVLAESGQDVFITVLAEPSLATAVADDILDRLRGRTGSPKMSVVNQITGAPDAGYVVEFSEVSSATASTHRRDIVVISARVGLTFNRAWS